ncbi:hypothetical protein POPTR_004G100201v4 [Populus trichocarpa]|uniref:Uncharacterized protein n=1 Tax=Populus trichocarpa TaxID=3694 RepID=A0ACC0T3V7_POPTR|nr:hypothetical protein POPTR_004G100201v4 [Populus trichocarpa]
MTVAKDEAKHAEEVNFRSLENQLCQRGLFMKYLLYCIRICARTNLQVFQGLWNPRSQTIEAILQLQNKTSEFSEKGMITRLLVPSSKVGCILGQGSQDINEMRRLQAEICVYPKNEKPKCASEDEELVQISGNYGVAKDVLVDIASDSEQELCMMKMLEQNLSVLDLSRALGWHTTCQE